MYKLIVDTSDTYFLESIDKDIFSLEKMHSNIMSKIIVGESVEGKSLTCIKLSTGEHTNKPSILFTGGIHAREDYSVMLVMKMLDYIAYHYNKDELWENIDIKKLLKKIDMYFLPVVNPDGLNIVHNGIKKSSNYEFIKDIPNISGKEECWKANANGVDINKNFDDGNWDKRKSKPEMSKPCSEGFKGIEANSEPETKALINLCKEKEFTMVISYHCTGNVIFWADSGTHQIFENLDEELIDKFTEKFIYRKTKISQDPSWYGCGFENFIRACYQRPSFCIELSPFSSPDQHPDYMFDELVWQHAKLTGVYFANEAIKISNKMYDVICAGKLVKTFYNKKEAINLAEEIEKSYVMFNRKIIWSNVEKYAALDIK